MERREWMLKLNHVSLTFNQGTQDEKKAIDDVTDRKNVG